MSKQKNPDYLNMSQDELYELARQKGVPGKSKMNRDELIHALETYELNKMPHAELHRKDMDELRKIGKEAGVENLWNLNKEELIENIISKKGK